MKQILEVRCRERHDCDRPTPRICSASLALAGDLATQPVRGANAHCALALEVLLNVGDRERADATPGRKLVSRAGVPFLDLVERHRGWNDDELQLADDVTSCQQLDRRRLD